MQPQFKSMNELVDYLSRVDRRLKTLEEENQKLRATPAQAESNMNELVEYLQEVEGRLKSVEEENQRLRALPAPASQPPDKETIAKMVAFFIPQTNIIHPSFWRRALAVWGHYFVVQLPISILLCIFYWLLLMTFGLPGGLR